MKKVLALLLLLVLLSSMGTARINSTIQQSCPADFEPLVSMAEPNATFNNPGPPGMYDWKVCVKGIIESNVADQCQGATGFYLSSNTTYAHFSDRKGYNLHVCTGNMLTSVRSNSCLSNQTALFSASDRINGYGRHIAGVNGSKAMVFPNVVCGYRAGPENVSVSMTFNLSSSDEVYFDDSQRGEFNYQGLAEYPYLVSTDGDTVAGIVASSYLEAERSLDRKNTLRLKRRSERAEFIIPFTQGDSSSIEDDEDEILSGNFLNLLQPSFSFFIPETPTVRVLLKQDIDIESTLSIGRGTYTIKITNEGDRTVSIEEQ